MKTIKNHLGEWGILYLTTVFWAIVFKTIALNANRGDSGLWLIVTYLALATGYTLGRNKRAGK